MPENELMSTIYKELIQLKNNNSNSKQKGSWFLKNEQIWIDIFSKEDVLLAKKRCSASLVIREAHIKTTVKQHLTPDRRAVIKKINKFWHVDKGEPV